MREERDVETRIKVEGQMKAMGAVRHPDPVGSCLIPAYIVVIGNHLGRTDKPEAKLWLSKCPPSTALRFHGPHRSCLVRYNSVTACKEPIVNL